MVRHAQASFGTDDYDRLSELGHRQSRWLGEYLAERQLTFARVVTGTLRRHGGSDRWLTRQWSSARRSGTSAMARPERRLPSPMIA